MVGLQTEIFKKNFIDAVRTYLPEAVVKQFSDTITLIHIGEKTIRLGNFPISIDPEEFERQLKAPDTTRNVDRLEKVLQKNDVQLIFNAGRLDYTKGFYEELLAFDRLLEKHPELIGKITLYQLAFPSRESIEAYKEYKESIAKLAKQINEKYRPLITQGVSDEIDAPFQRYPGMPVRQVHGQMGRSRYLAHLHIADIQSIPTKADGMNLVSKESAVVGKPTTVQILGKAAGVAEEFGEYTLLVDPKDTESFSDVLYRAYMMEESERRERKSKMLEAVNTNDVFSWWSKEQEPAFQQIWDEKRIKTSH